MTVRLTRLERYIGDNGPVIPKVTHEDFDLILDGITHGMVAFRNRLESQVNKVRDELTKRTEELENLKLHLEDEVERRVMEWMDEATLPTP